MKQIKSIIITACILLPSMSYGMMQRFTHRTVHATEHAAKVLFAKQLSVSKIRTLNGGKKLFASAAGGAAVFGLGAYAQRHNNAQGEERAENQRQPKTLQAHKPSSLWAQLIDGELSRRHYVDTFVRDCSALHQENNRIPRHKKNENTVRIATYNVHALYNPYGFGHSQYNEAQIKAVIEQMNADVLVLQEVGFRTPLEAFGSLGYCHRLRSACGQNAIVSKYPIKMVDNHIFASDVQRRLFCTRSLMHVEVALPNNNTISLYGTHLDVYDNTEEARLGEVQEIVGKTRHDGHANTLVLADFNAVRQADYQYAVNGHSVWDLLQESDKRRTGIATQTKAIEALEHAGFKDCFTHARVASPKFSVWSGTLIDFIFLDKRWHLPVKGCYTWYDSASDHLPIIMDVGVEKKSH